MSESTSASSAPIRQRTAVLAPGAQLFVWSLRTWRRLKFDLALPRSLLATPYSYCGAEAALAPLEELMWLLERAGQRAVDISRPFQRYLTEHEQRLLAALRLRLKQDCARCEEVLGAWMPAAAARTTSRVLGEYGQAVTAAGVPFWRPPTLELSVPPVFEIVRAGRAS